MVAVHRIATYWSIAIVDKLACSSVNGGIPLQDAAERQADRHRRADPLLAVDDDMPAMQLDEADGERQPQTRSGVLAVPGTGYLAEAGDRRGDFGLVHADAVVDDLDAHPVLGDAGTDPDPAAGMAEFNGVGDEVEQHLLELQPVGPELRHRGADLDVDGDVERAGALDDEMQDVAHHLADIHVFVLDLDLAGF